MLFLRNKNNIESSFGEIILIALTFRLILIGVEPVTSDDFHRYLWDGMVQAAGINPYQFAPKELLSLHDKIIYPNVTYSDLKTIYPPAAQFIFFLSYKISPVNALGFKLVYLAADMGIIFFLFKILKLIKTNSNYVFLYALSPLILFEFFINVHIDIILLFFLSAAVYFALTKRINISFLCLGLSILSKVYSVIFLPLFIVYFLKSGLRLRKISVGILFFVLSFSVAVVNISGLKNIFSVFKNYMQHWYSNNLIFRLILSINEFFGIENHQVTRFILAAAFLTAFFFVIKSGFSFLQKMYLISFFYLYFSHTVHPWYLTLLVLFLPVCVTYSALFWSWIAGLTNFTVYYYLKDKIWSDMLPVLIFEYLAVTVLIIADIKFFRLPVRQKKPKAVN